MPLHSIPTQLTFIRARLVDLLAMSNLDNSSQSINGSTNTSGFGSGSGSGSGSGMSGSGNQLLPGSGLDVINMNENEIIILTNYTLTGGENLPLSYDSTVLRLKVTFDDRNELKRLIDLATFNGNTFISITHRFIEDTNNNQIVAIDIDEPLPVSNFTADFTPPELLRFDLNMDTRDLILYFSETVNVETLNISAITLQSTQELVEGATEYFTLTNLPQPFGSYSPSENGPTLLVKIGEYDANQIKYLTQLAQDTNSTYISLTTFTIEDMNGNLLVPISDENATQITTYLPDVTGPVLRDFSLNLTAERLVLTFDETVDFRSIIPALITIQNSEDNQTTNIILFSCLSCSYWRKLKYSTTKPDSYSTRLKRHQATIRLSYQHQ